MVLQWVVACLLPGAFTSLAHIIFTVCKRRERFKRELVRLLLFEVYLFVFWWAELSSIRLACKNVRRTVHLTAYGSFNHEEPRRLDNLLPHTERYRLHIFVSENELADLAAEVNDDLIKAVSAWNDTSGASWLRFDHFVLSYRCWVKMRHRRYDDVSALFARPSATK